MTKKAAARAHGGTPAVIALESAGVPFTQHAYEHDPSSDLGYGLEAAAALGVEPSQVFKTLVSDVDGRLVVGIVPVDRTLDLKALARAVGGKKATLADPHAAERASGYVVGGISPLGLRSRIAVVLDESALGFETVYVSGGRRGFDVGLAPSGLVQLIGAVTAPVARG